MNLIAIFPWGVAALKQRKCRYRVGQNLIMQHLMWCGSCTYVAIYHPYRAMCLYSTHEFRWTNAGANATPWCPWLMQLPLNCPRGMIGIWNYSTKVRMITHLKSTVKLINYNTLRRRGNGRRVSFGGGHKPSWNSPSPQMKQQQRLFLRHEISHGALELRTGC